MGNCCEFIFRKNSSTESSSLLEDYDFEITYQINKYGHPNSPGKKEKYSTCQTPGKITRKNTMTIYSEEKCNKKISINDFEALKLLGKGSFGKVMLVEQKTSGISLFFEKF